MRHFSDYLDFIDSRRSIIPELLIAWANINSFSYNTPGLDKMLNVLESAFRPFNQKIEKIELGFHQPLHSAENAGKLFLGRALRIRKRLTARPQVFLCCHMDTVFPPDHPFQECSNLDDNRIQGPGVTDAKGGLLVMLEALEAFERSPWADELGWEVLINPDEEIGSPGSKVLLEEATATNDIGLIFEPSLSDGNLVGSRKGSGNFMITVKGRAAHAGREPDIGRNAINALADFIVQLNSLPPGATGLTLNVGYIEGGGPVNVVPDTAICRFNVRVSNSEDQQLFEDHLELVKARINQIDGISIESRGEFSRPPKPLDNRTEKLLGHFAAVGQELGLSLESRFSGGACDGNNLAAWGLPTIDSLGATGNGIHSSKEYVLIPSIVERAKLTALFMMKLADGAISLA
jgi:glutamate carboxypeptidase